MMFLHKFMLLVSACFLFYGYTNSYKLDSYHDLMNVIMQRLKDHKRSEEYQESYNVRNSLAENVEKDEKLTGRAFDYDALISERSDISMPIHEDERDNEDFVDENLNDLIVKEELPDNIKSNEVYVEKQGKQQESDTKTHVLKMPGVAPKKMDTYLCYSYMLPEDDHYIVGFTPLAKMQVAHHMLLFGCKAPWKQNVAWNCREMQPVCAEGPQKIMYAWAKNAPPLKMPDGVGFHVGKNSGVRYLVVQVHYLHVDSFKNGATDSSGLKFELTKQRKRFLAGIYLLANGWNVIPPHKKKVHLDMGCQYPSEAPKIQPFRFRTHAHKLGVVITGYRIRDGKWSLIGRGDPQRPQAFYRVFNDLDVRPGDKLVGRCTYNSMSRSEVTRIGATHSDEMCNFYIMYFYDSYNGTTNNIDCLPLDTESLSFPKDSDVSLQEMEKRMEKVKVSKSNSNTLYKVVPHWPSVHQPDGDLGRLGQVSGVAYDNENGLVLIFHRGKREWDALTFDAHNNVRKKYRTLIPQETLIWVDKNTGKIVKSAGQRMFSVPHGVTIDHEGHIWVSDVGSHQVFKLSPHFDESTKNLPVLLAIGERFVNGHDGKHFCKPTDVAVMVDGSFFVADGYCNSRVAKFDPKGNMLEEISESSFKFIYSFPTPKYMNVVHSLALDEENHRLFVADRENRRILIFNSNTGEFITHISNVFDGGAVYAVTYNRHDGGVLHVVNGESYGRNIRPSGFTWSLKKKKIIGRWKPQQGLSHPHDVTVSSNNRHIFVAEIGPNKVWRFDSATSNSRP